ncbi:MAG: MBL fold metallo-hydrolase [Eubacteriales bacterium]|nr:MBL fold metallo-hydrolase [Eubacteriales bacterium]
MISAYPLLEGLVSCYPEWMPQANLYLIHGAAGDYLIDPSRPPQEIEAPERVRMIFATHGHYDHIQAIEAWRDFNPELKLYMHPLAREVLADYFENCSSLFNAATRFDGPDIEIEETLVELEEGLSLEALAMPGHSRDSLVYLLKQKDEYRALFSGDVIFFASVGRSDFKGSNPEALAQSLVRILSLPGERGFSAELPIYPGHGPATTFRHETLYNPYCMN